MHRKDSANSVSNIPGSSQLVESVQWMRQCPVPQMTDASLHESEYVQSIVTSVASIPFITVPPEHDAF